jgi:hypothetical protein
VTVKWRHVDSKLTCLVYVAHDLSGFSFRIFQPRVELVSRTVGWNTAKVRSGYSCTRTVTFTEWKWYGSAGICNCWR